MVGLWKISNEKGKSLGFLTIYVLYSIKKSPKTGYEILSEIKQKCGDKWSPSKGTIYPLLKQLEKENLIRVKKVGSRSKNIFEISPKGKKFLSSMRKEKQKLREKFSYFRDLFAGVMGEENMNIAGLILEIKETSLTKTKKDEVKKILEHCLSELRRVE
jgi:DNA-binding PadR family transcriptional regulator